MQNYYNQFLFHNFLSALHVSDESNRSLSGARYNILYYTVWYNRYIIHHQEHGIIYCITQFGTIGTSFIISSMA